MNTTEMAQSLRKEANKLIQAANLLEASSNTKSRTGSRVMSPEAREKLSKAQKERWARVREAAHPTKRKGRSETAQAA
jgi:hypothetical protein